MPSGLSGPVSGLIRRLAAVGGLTDAQLLARFVARRDEAAFAALVRRHGPRVLGVCRQLLRHSHDVEDAFQATFLVLARKAGSITRAELLGNWLYGVAYRVAARARAGNRRRHALEGGDVDALPARRPGREVSLELLGLLHEEVQRLPEKYRLPVVLCYLEGRTREEAAGRLGWTEGAVKGRLERARALLRRRLARRGVGLTPALLAAALSDAAEAAPLPAPLAAATVRAALHVASGGAGAVAVPIVALAEGVLDTMSPIKLTFAAALLLAAAVLGGALTYHAWAAEPSDEPRAVRPAPAAAAVDRDPDSDGDGLSDFQEVHKYRTDPRKKDTAGDGVPDGDPGQRREFTYSVRAVLRVLRPYNLKAMNDDYQDVRVRAENDRFAELEVTLYPLNSNADDIPGNPAWKKDYAGMREHLAPGVTTNWDEPMRKDLLRALAADGIDPDRLTDKEVVEKVSRWLFARSQFRNMFCTYYVHFPGGRPEVYPGLEGAFGHDKGDKDWTVRQQLEHELLGKEMFARKSHGTCTSAAVYQCTVLRALGIPTRMVLAVPLADPTDDAQVALVAKGLTHHQVRRAAYHGLLGAGYAFTAHTFCEVYVGHRWRCPTSPKTRA
jgi:RNA polymerase sigma factor (sigma-70 family)